MLDDVITKRRSEICKCGHSGADHAGVIYAGYCLAKISGIYSDDERMDCPCPRFTWDAGNELNLRRLSHDKR